MKETIIDTLKQDIRFKEALNACMNCGVCTAICPAAEFYRYDPRIICNIVQSKNIDEIEHLLKSDTIWYCGQCMSCKTRCPRGNVPGLLIMVLRWVSQEGGYFTQSEKGRQQYALEQVVGQSIINSGYCVYPDMVTYENHVEQGPVWKWYLENIEEVSNRLGAKYKQETAGALRKIKKENIDEIKKIFEVTGGMAFYKKIEKESEKFAQEQQINMDDFFMKVYTDDNGTHR